MAPVSDMEVSSMSDRRGARDRTLSLEDCLCPVCLEMFLEPVTLPCTHTFCKSCFLESVDKTTLCCPMCRKRVSTWARLHSRNNTLVNEALWTQIQASFPQQLQRRLSGQDASDCLADMVSFPRVSQPGEVRQEYQDQVTKLMEERRELDEAERLASEEYIQRLLAEEEEQLQEDRRRREEDEQMARHLSLQLNSGPAPPGTPPPADTPAKKKVGLIEKFFCHLPSKSSPLISNKENILLSQPEGHLPQLDFYGSQTRPLDDLLQKERPDPPVLRASSEDLGPTSSKRKSSELDTSEEEAKRGRLFTTTTSSSSSSSSTSSLGAVSAPWGSYRTEAELLSRQQQEEEDLQMALQLQKELDQEERQRAGSRHTGSPDAYQLRPRRSTSARTPGRSPEISGTQRTSSKTPSTASRSAGSSQSSSPRGPRQVKLTTMFSRNSS